MYLEDFEEPYPDEDEPIDWADVESQEAQDARMESGAYDEGDGVATKLYGAPELVGDGADE